MPSSKRTPTPKPTESARASTHPGKGRPTPKRKEAEAARRRPLVPDTRGDAKARKAALREQRRREQEAMINGDERYLPSRDKGPVRRMARDVVDARRNFGDYFIWCAFGLLAVMFLIPALMPLVGAEAAGALLVGMNGLTMVIMVVAVLDGWRLARLLRHELEGRFGAEKVSRATVRYGVLRAYQMRRMRMPKPQVERGQRPR